MLHLHTHINLKKNTSKYKKSISNIKKTEYTII